MKNCDRKLWSFQAGGEGGGGEGGAVFHYWPANFLSSFLPPVNWLASWFVHSTLSLNWLTCRLQIKAEILSSERASNLGDRQRKMN